MTTPPRRHAISTPGERPDPSGRSRGSIVASLVLHGVLLIALVQITVGPPAWVIELMRKPPEPVERIGFLQLPKGEPPTEAPRRGGNDRPVALIEKKTKEILEGKARGFPCGAARP